MKILLSSTNTHHVFISMNAFEKEKYLRFCERSVMKIPNMLNDFRYIMAIDPYNIYYLPIIGSPDELLIWDETDESKELFFK